MKKKCFLGLVGIIAGVGMFLPLTACHMIKVRTNDSQYLQAKTAPVLTVPQGASRRELGNDYPIAGSAYPTQSVSIVPPGSLLETQLEQKALQKKSK